MEVQIRQIVDEDWSRVREIYLQGIATGQSTFETSAPSWEGWNAAHLPFARLVAEVENEIQGWAVLSPVSQRAVYAGVAEVSVYVAASARGKGVGRQLLNALIEHSEAAGIWTLQAGMFPENIATIALHKSCGFREVGRRERIGKLDRWRDTVQMERRSKRVGVD